MIRIEIPYVVENNRINKTSTKNEIDILKISDKAKAEVFTAIYHRYPVEVSFENNELQQVLLLETTLQKLGIPYRQIKE